MTASDIFFIFIDGTKDLVFYLLFGGIAQFPPTPPIEIALHLPRLAKARDFIRISRRLGLKITLDGFI